jgi:hypothetical protein
MSEKGVWRFCGMTLTAENQSTGGKTRHSVCLPSEIPQGLLKHIALHKHNKNKLDKQA